MTIVDEQRKKAEEQYLKQLNESKPKSNSHTPTLNRKERRTYAALRQREATKKRLGLKSRGAK